MDRISGALVLDEDVCEPGRHACNIMRLREIMRNRSLRLVKEPRFLFQPIMSVLGGGVVAYEVLSRCDMGNGDTQEAMRLMEESGEIVSYDLDMPLRLLSLLRESRVDGRIDTLAVNVSAKTINLFPDAYLSACARLRPYVRIIVEITESMDPDIDAIEYFSRKAHNREILVALDDATNEHVFSLPYTIKRTRPDLLKIDGKKLLEWHLTRDADSLNETIVYAKSMMVRIVAEHIENPAVKDWAIELGCDYLQGFLIGAPISLSQICSD